MQWHLLVWCNFHTRHPNAGVSTLLFPYTIQVPKGLWIALLLHDAQCFKHMIFVSASILHLFQMDSLNGLTAQASLSMYSDASFDVALSSLHCHFRSYILVTSCCQTNILPGGLRSITQNVITFRMAWGRAALVTATLFLEGCQTSEEFIKSWFWPYEQVPKHLIQTKVYTQE